MKKSVYLFVVLFFSFILVGCKDATESSFQVSLIVNGITYEELTFYPSDESRPLPFPELDEELFLGWSNGSDLYFDEYTPIEGASLTAVVENISDVLTYQVAASDSRCIEIVQYTGNATYLVIPPTIDDFVVNGIMSNAFKNTGIVSIYLPVEASVYSLGFTENYYLEEVHYYGEYILPVEKVIGNTEYEAILSENADDCVVSSVSVEGKAYTFSEGCPIIEVTDVDSVTIAGTIYSNYVVLMEPNLVESISTNFVIGSFTNNPVLKSVDIPASNYFFDTDSIIDSPLLGDLIVSENSISLKTIDHVLYTFDGTRLLYYPSGLTDLSFTIPDAVTSISSTAFEYNTVLETIVIPSGYHGEFLVNGLSGLKNIIVNEGNTFYYAVDGVLYSNQHELIKYPASKEGSSYTVSSGTLVISAWAFSENQNLTSIDLGSSITTIDDYAFLGSVQLNNINIPSSVTMIRMYVFHDSSIDTIIINRSVVVDETITRILSWIDISTTETLYRIYVPDDSVEAYCADDYWGAYSAYIHPLSSYQE